MVGAVADATCDVARHAWERFVEIVLDGMRESRSHPTPLPAEPLDEEQFAAAMARAGSPGSRSRRGG